MNSFDIAMNHLDKAFGFVSAPHTWTSRKDEADKIVVVERGARGVGGGGGEVCFKVLPKPDKIAVVGRGARRCR